VYYGSVQPLEDIVPGTMQRAQELDNQRVAEMEAALIQSEPEALARVDGARRYAEHLRDGMLDDQDQAWLLEETTRNRSTMTDVEKPSVRDNNRDFLRQLRLVERAIPRSLDPGTEDTTFVEIEKGDEYVMCVLGHLTLVRTIEGYCGQNNTLCNRCPFCRKDIKLVKYVNT
jgi:hypothetical protein